LPWDRAQRRSEAGFRVEAAAGESRSRDSQSGNNGGIIARKMLTSRDDGRTAKASNRKPGRGSTTPAPLKKKSGAGRGEKHSIDLHQFLLKKKPGKKLSSVDRLAISFEHPLAERVRQAALKATDGNVSAWLAGAASRELQMEGRRELLREYEAVHGVITDEEMAEAQRLWPRD
jgi:hypothetical protein